MNPPLSKAHYRAEIDGLRALAVLAVVLYHARVPGLSGGFAGVDVFFAISGYVVMLALRREQVSTGQIDWMRFLVRRVRRLLPMLLVTIAIALLLGYWLIAPFGEFQHLSKSAMAAAGFSANLYLWRFAGSYFSAGVEQMPLMHLWSLSVEEQFYLLTPLVFLLARWRRLGGLPTIILTLTIISFVITVWGSTRHPTATFYLPVTRAWEFGVGALAAVLAVRLQWPRWIGTALLAALVACLFGLDAEATWLPLYTGVPALLTAAWLLHASGEQTRAASTHWLRSRWLCWIGERSYAWYLLHWPFMVFYRKYYLEDVSTLELLLVSLAALIAADAAHRWIERPARFGSWPGFRSNTRLLSLAAAATAGTVTVAFALGVHAFERQTAPQWQAARAFDRWVAEAFQCMRAAAPNSGQPRACRPSATASQTQPLLLWGDSHAYHLVSVLSTLAPQKSFALHTWSMGGCPPVLDYRGTLNGNENERRACTDFIGHAHDAIVSSQQMRPTIVVLAARWEPYQGELPISLPERAASSRRLAKVDIQTEQANFAGALLATTKDLVSRDIEVIIVAPIPEQRVFAPDCSARFGTAERCLTPRIDVEQYRQSTLRLLQAIRLQSASVQIIDPIDVLCGNEWCDIGPEGALWYVDDDHLSEHGAALLQPALAGAIANAQSRITQRLLQRPNHTQ